MFANVFIVIIMLEIWITDYTANIISYLVADSMKIVLFADKHGLRCFAQTPKPPVEQHLWTLKLI